MAVPYIFANATTTIPLSELDSNFATAITLGNTAVYLGNTTTSIGNLSLTNVTISSVGSTFPNSYLANSTTTLGNATLTLGGTTTSVGNLTLTNATISTGNVTVTDLNVSNSAVISANTAGDALRITQTGAGNALLVEDSTNPDSTPFVVDAAGAVFIGNAASAGSTSTGIQPQTQVIGTGASTSIANNKAAIGQYRFFNDTGGAGYFFFKSRSATPGSFVTVNSGDALGTFFWQADDGTSFIRAASISSSVDAAPSTNSMPGRLVFSTTASGAATPTERMRIDSAGNVGIGGVGTGISIAVAKNITGSTFSSGISSYGTIQSDVTSRADGYLSYLSTANASFTLAQLNHFAAYKNTFGASSTVTSQFGFYANSSLIDATNNYGFYSEIASGTGRWNFYANGTADNAFAGSSSFGTTSAPTALVTIAAGTATANTAPLKFTSGTNLTTPEAGVIEYDGTIMSATTNTSFKRGTIPITNYTSGIGTSGVTATTDYAIFPAANDTITLPVGTYLVRMAVRVAVAGSTVNQPCTLNIRGGGTAVGSFSWRGTGSILDAGAASSFVVAATALGTVITVTATSAANPRQYIFIGQGILKVTTQGTIIPSYQFPGTLTSGTTTLVADNYMTIQQLDTQSAAAFGPAGTGWG